jgi:hypothetical protein
MPEQQVIHRHRGELVTVVREALGRALGDPPHEWVEESKHEDIVATLTYVIKLAAGQLDLQKEKGGE